MKARLTTRGLGLDRYADAEEQMSGAPAIAGVNILSRAIQDLGYQPFIALEVAQAGRTEAVLCETQNDVEDFVHRIRLRGISRSSDFVEGLCLALTQHRDEAVDKFAAWLERGDPVTVERPTPATAGFANCVGYPLLRLGADDHGPVSAAPRRRAKSLATLVAGFAHTGGNDFARWTLCEAAALALARSAAAGGMLDFARQAVIDACLCLPESVPLAAARRCLDAAGDRSGRAAAALYEAVRRNRHQPLFAIAVSPVGAAPYVLLCSTGEHLANFITEARNNPVYRETRFLQAFVAALEGETYAAAAEFFAWLDDAGDRFGLAIELFDTEKAPFPNPNGYPLIYLSEILPEEACDVAWDKARLLGEIFDNYEARPGNEASRNPLLEALAFALSKYFGSRAEYSTALGYVARALTEAPRSIHLKAAENALQRRLAGEPVPDRLVKFIGPDNGALADRICRQPFTRFDIGPNGDVLLCCGHWLPTSIGNLMTDSADAVLNSPTAQKIRASMLDGSFRYCNHLECTPMVQDALPRKSETREPVLRAAIERGQLTTDRVRAVLFSFDQSCNLACPSCRTHQIVERDSENMAKAQTVERKLLPLLPNLRTLYINPAGEFLASKPSRRLLELVSRELCPELEIDIISNGTLFSRREWEKFANIHDIVRAVRISIDACTKPTFEVLRRLGNFDRLCENLEFLAGLRSSGGLRQLRFSFTYQLGNFCEMKDFIDFARRYRCDFVIFERLQNLGAFTDREFREQAVHLRDHPLHMKFLSVVRDPMFRHPFVWHDFEWEQTTVYHSVADRARSASVPAGLVGDALETGDATPGLFQDDR